MKNIKKEWICKLERFSAKTKLIGKIVGKLIDYLDAFVLYGSVYILHNGTPRVVGNFGTSFLGTMISIQGGGQDEKFQEGQKHFYSALIRM